MKHKNLTKQIVKLNRNQEMGSRRDSQEKRKQADIKDP
jgi:hypothetical protein